MPIYESKLVNSNFKGLFMKRLVLGLLTLSLIVSLNGCSSEDEKSQEVQEPNKSQEIKKPQSSPIRIAVDTFKVQGVNWYAHHIDITSLVDSIIIKKIIVNKGNCKFLNTGVGHLSYAQKAQITVHKCNILRIDVETNQGDWSVEY
jgi:hypothetical protein